MYKLNPHFKYFAIITQNTLQHLQLMTREAQSTLATSEWTYHALLFTNKCCYHVQIIPIFQVLCCNNPKSSATPATHDRPTKHYLRWKLRNRPIMFSIHPTIDVTNSSIWLLEKKPWSKLVLDDLKNRKQLFTARSVISLLTATKLTKLASILCLWTDEGKDTTRFAKERRAWLWSGTKEWCGLGAHVT